MYEPITTQITVKPENDPLFSEMATMISLDDEGAGMFVVLRQDARENGKICIQEEEWPVIRNQIDMMIRLCESYNRKEKACDADAVTD